jgi:photosystem II stability/assembly factor-like uncharacterized protein
MMFIIYKFILNIKVTSKRLLQFWGNKFFRGPYGLKVERNGVMQNIRRLIRLIRKSIRPIGLVITVTLFSLFSMSSELLAGIELNDDLFDVSFPTLGTSADKEQNLGWICGRWGTVLHTQNGGEVWNRQSSGIDMTLGGICFVDHEFGWAVGDEGTIIHTKDGGGSWEQQNSPASGFLMDVCFVDRLTGWIVTERTTILHTKDGGQTWTVQFSDNDFILKAVSFSDTQNGWAVGEYGYIYHTQDGGNTWRQQAGSFDLSDETGEIIGENFLFDVTAINQTTAWVVGVDGYLARTTDSGATWTPVIDCIPRTHLFGITSDNSGQLLIVGNAVMLTSAFGGWKPDFQRLVGDSRLFQPVAGGTCSIQALAGESRLKYGWLYGVAANGPGKFVAVGKGGWIYLIDKNQPTRRVIISR